MSPHCSKKASVSGLSLYGVAWFLTKKWKAVSVRLGGRTVSLVSRSWLLLAVLTLVGLIGCQTTTESPWGADRPQMALAGSVRMADQSLYVRLGEKPAIVSIVDDFVTRVVADMRIKGRFTEADIPHLKAMLVDQICQTSGGPCVYEGRDMKLTHAGMSIVGEEFEALVGDLIATLDKFEVGKREQGELLSALRPMKTDIVDKPIVSKP